MDLPKIGIGIEGALKLLGVDLAVLVQNVRIHAGNHVDLRMAPCRPEWLSGRRGSVSVCRWYWNDGGNPTLLSVSVWMGKMTDVSKNLTKNLSSFRTLPLIPEVEQALLAAKEQQKAQKKLCGRSYCKDYQEYICVDEMGQIVSPDYVTRVFPAVLMANNRKKIRFHDLRHSCASLLLKNNVSMKEVQIWLGHSNFSTTANIYAHLDTESKRNAANTISSVMSESQNTARGKSRRKQK